MGDEFDSDLDETPTKRSAKGSSIKWETILPIIVIILVVLLVLLKTNLISGGIDFITGAGKSRILVIGSPSIEFKHILNDAENRDLIEQVRYVSEGSLSHNPSEIIEGYDIVVLDQSNQPDKSLTRPLGEAIASYVGSGGNLILVLNSGIERPNDLSVLGWKATFGNIIPVSCDNVSFNLPSCKDSKFIQGTLYAVKTDHPIMYGINRVPALETSGLINTQTYPVAIKGTELAYLEDVRGNTYTGIVEKNLNFGGKVIYFNFNPGVSNEIIVNTIKYLS
jgi:hypothetical protein